MGPGRFWALHDRLDQGEDLELGDVSDDEKAMVKKMVITAFWCIQLLPSDRPSMSKVLKMLESDVELLEMAPNINNSMFIKKHNIMFEYVSLLHPLMLYNIYFWIS
ncbi:hypothetical protein ES319_D01G039700v1 [Gossypium barbadense]|uniref:Serine-threonine/tyrosine-protein kinase catalytic domain-containing protein n=1 Tax=Gossypium barbadense TaxID=3634 RepID=A0A5J5SJK7_GOSBA|nr:hypothetical protein ES319_D01G039700v1 [Gossypium barbadense]